MKTDEIMLQNVKSTACAIEVASAALRELAGTNLDGNEMKDAESLVAQELHSTITERADVI